jgi:hypothetical protein
VGSEKTNQFSLGLRYHLAPNVFLTGEYMWMKTEAEGTIKSQSFMLMTHFLF